MRSHSAAIAGHAPAKPRRFYQALYFQVLAGVILGVLVGHFWPDVAIACKPLGDAFIRIVRMMIVPVVLESIRICGVSGMEPAGSGKLAW